MTPQERDLITALIDRLRAQASQSKDPEADALIHQAVAAQPDIPYLLTQTVLIQDMALHNAEHRIADLENQVAHGPAAAPQAQTSFLGAAARSLGFGGPWGRAAAAAAQPAPVQPTPVAPVAAPAAPMMVQGSGGGFLRQAATTAAGIAGGALLFEGIQSLFGPHYGSGFLGGLQQQPGLSETVINNYYDDRGSGSGSNAAQLDPSDKQSFDDTQQSADNSQDQGQDDLSGQDDLADAGSDQDFGGDGGGSFDT
jgi:uncharacterized protein